MKCILIILVFLFCSLGVSAQNHIANSSFEFLDPGEPADLPYFRGQANKVEVSDSRSHIDTSRVSVPWFSGLRLQGGVGTPFVKGEYIPYIQGGPGGQSSNTLAGFYRNPIRLNGHAQLDYDLLSKDRKLALFVGLGYTYYRTSFDGIKDSLIAYGLDTNILRKVGQHHIIGASVSLNADKILRIFSEVGMNIGILHIGRSVEQGQARKPAYAYLSYSQSYLYTAIGYGFNLRPLRITPYLRYSYYPFGGGHTLGLGLILSILAE